VTAAASLIGTRFGNYELQSLLGRGGMAAVYQGFDHNLHRAVAVKVLFGAVAAQPDFIDRFRQEARLIARLRHPHIVQVYDFGEQDGYIYMVQELLTGPTLEQYLSDASTRGATLPTSDIIRITQQIASALDAAHAAGIIHRDVKPSNIMWNASGALALTDFGIAKNTAATMAQTQTGFVMGTPNYLSPEQAQGIGSVTAVSDIYSLGVVVYEMITGKAPFSGDTPMSIVMHHIQTPPPPLRTLRPDAPPAVEAVIQQALAKDPSQRFQKASAFAQALERAWTAPAQAPVAAPVGVHDQATRVWNRPAQAPAAKPSAPAAVPAPTVAQPKPQPQRPAPAPPPRPPAVVDEPTRQSSSMLLPALGLLLAVVLLGGGFFALRNSGLVIGAATTPTDEPAAVVTTEPTPELPTPLPTDVPPTPLPTDVPPTEIPQPTAEIVADTPVVVPQQPVESTLQPAAPPVQPPSSAEGEAQIAQLRQLLATGAAEGRLGKNSEKFAAQINQALDELVKGDVDDAATGLQNLQQRIQKDADSGNADAAFVQQVNTSIDSIFNAYGLIKQPAPIEGSDDD
jgi:serine/threonine-protein kinase